MMVEKRQTYTAEFKHEAVRLVTVHGDGVAKAARNVGSNATRLDRWKRAQEARADKVGCRPNQQSPTACARNIRVSAWSGSF
jgi:transposase-like protein